MVALLIKLEQRRHTMSHDTHGDEIAKIFKIPREMLDKAASMRPELRRQVKEGTMDFEETARRRKIKTTDR